MKVLVTGGAGYIGSHAVRKLVSDGHQVLVLDDLSKGHREAVSQSARFILGSIGDSRLVSRLLSDGRVDAILHFAGFIEVGESVEDPAKYYANNFAKSLSLLRVAAESGVKKFIFSSTAAVYGTPIETPIREDHPLQPINPYGRSKMMLELALQDFRKAYGLEYTIFRYFNVAGAAHDHRIGEAHEPETHLIPNVLVAARLASRPVQVFGTDYPTKDGTCVRDYVHVEDLVAAHVLALDEAESNIYNIGSESGFSVREVIAACERVTGRRIAVLNKPRRAGDPHSLVASSRKLRERLGWRPRFGDLDTIIAHAWSWHESHPFGYGAVPRAANPQPQVHLQ